MLRGGEAVFSKGQVLMTSNNITKHFQTNVAAAIGGQVFIICIYIPRKYDSSLIQYDMFTALVPS